jgi:energy-converting hydrogenase Eha subunit E
MWIRKSLSRLAAALAWNKASYALMSLFVLAILLILYIWQPLVKEYLSLFDPAYPLWMQIDWLLVCIFAFMSLMIMAGADLRHDAQVAFVGLVGGLVIESWGTQTSLWTYYTDERPPLWIIPAWPIASLAIDRMARLADRLLPGEQGKAYRLLYAGCFGIFLLIMVRFVGPTFDKPLTWMALLLCVLLILVPHDHRLALLTFAAGAALGYFLERWGTTRECWTYYTGQTPPLFAVLAHGMAAVAFWRARLLLVMVVARYRKKQVFTNAEPGA